MDKRGMITAYLSLAAIMSAAYKLSDLNVSSGRYRPSGSEVRKWRLKGKKRRSKV